MIINNTSHPKKRISLSPQKPISRNISDSNIIQTKPDRNSMTIEKTIKLVTFIKENNNRQVSTNFKSTATPKNPTFTNNSDNYNSNKFKAIDCFKEINSNSEPTLIKIKLETKFEESQLISSNFKEINKTEIMNIGINSTRKIECNSRLSEVNHMLIGSLNSSDSKFPQVVEDGTHFSLNKAFILDSFTDMESLSFSQISSIEKLIEGENAFSIRGNDLLLKDINQDNKEVKEQITLINDHHKNLVHRRREFNYNHKDLPIGKENNEKYKLSLINRKFKKDENPPFNSDFGKKRIYRNLTNKENYHHVNFNNRFRKISSCKKIYESVLFFHDRENKKISFKIFKEEDIGLKKINFNSLLRVNDEDEDVETDEDYLKIANFHVVGTICETIKELANDQELWEEMKNRRNPRED